MTAPAAPPRHAKCGRELRMVRGEWYCMKCWCTVEVATLTVEEAILEQLAGEGRERRRDAQVPVGRPWTEKERETWDTWKEGDPIPGEQQQMEPEELSIKVLNTTALGKSCIESLRYLAEQKALLDAKTARITEEAAKLVHVARFTGVPIPQELEALARAGKHSSGVKAGAAGAHGCACGRAFGTFGALQIHRARIHGEKKSGPEAAA